MWEIDFISQLTTFGYSLAFGAAFCLPYDILGAIRLCLVKRKITIFLIDISFFLVAGILTFFLFQATCSGEVRGFVFIGELVGYFVFQRLFSAHIRRFFCFIIKGLQGAVRTLRRRIFLPLVQKLRKTSEKNEKKGQKSLFFLKKVLKKHRPLVYTKEKCAKNAK